MAIMQSAAAFLRENALAVAAAVLLWNIVVFALYGLDKARAQRRAWRIPERVLLGCAAIFGGFGAVLGMQLFRHKTKHKKFVWLAPLFLFLQAGLVAIVLFWG